MAVAVFAFAGAAGAGGGSGFGSQGNWATLSCDSLCCQPYHRLLLARHTAAAYHVWKGKGWGEGGRVTLMPEVPTGRHVTSSGRMSNRKPRTGDDWTSQQATQELKRGPKSSRSPTPTHCSPPPLVFRKASAGVQAASTDCWNTWTSQIDCATIANVSFFKSF